MRLVSFSKNWLLLLALAANLGAASSALADTTKTGFVSYVDVRANGTVSLQLSLTIGGSAVELCTTGATTYSEAVIGSSNVTETSVKMILATLTAAKLAGRSVTVVSSDNGSGTCRFVVVVLN